MRYLLLLGLAAFSAANALENDEPCVCPFIWKPVCGNDGNTYPNECTLKCVKLVSEPDLEVAHQGTCKHGLQAAQEEEVPELEKSCACPIIWNPVCGNDGNTYPSECILNCVKLKLKPDLEVAYQGACKHGLLAAQEEEVQGLRNPCECPRTLHRVCGSDGHTYSNPCMLNCAKHESNPDLVQVHEGPCDEHDHDFEDPCQCDNKFEPVCGDDQITYMNLCHLECAAFTTSPGVEMAYEGECHAEINDAMQILLEGNPCECPRVLHWVCGSDGNTYSNPCMLNCAKHEGKSDLVQVHEGPCDEHDHDFEDPCQCDDTFEPVCGDDEVTYRNLCHLECAAFTTSPGVEVKHEGECHPDIKVNQVTQKSCVCPKIYRPVCGSDGQTYSNLCVLDCQISSNPGLKLSHFGKCLLAPPPQAIETEEVRKPCNCFRNFNPVCGTDGRTYSNPCMLDCAAATKMPGLKLLHNGRCLPKEEVTEEFALDDTEFIKDPCFCPKIWQPVCGTDGRTYANKCTLNCAKLSGNPDLKIAYREQCSCPADEIDRTKKEYSCVCNKMYLPVCGTDGITYNNPCLLYCAAFIKSSDLNIAGYGRCPNDYNKNPF